MSDYTPISLIRGNSTVIDETSIVDGQILFDESRKCLFMDDGDTRSKYSGLGADSNVATVEDTTTSTHTYAKGDYVVVEGQLYEVTAAIAIGDTFTVGTNITQTTVGDELVQIKSDLGDSWQLQPNARNVTLATANGVKTVSQLMSDALVTLRALTIPSGYGWRLMDVRIPVSTTGRQQMIIMPEGIRTAFASTTNIQAYAVVASSVGVATYGVNFNSGYVHQMHNTTYTDLGTIVPNNGLTLELWYELYKRIN